jgi:hypothetical protein
MAITGFASLVRRAGRGVALGLAALVIAGGGLLTAPAAPASAASALTASIKTTSVGGTVVRDFDLDFYNIKVKNTGTTTLNSVYLEISHTTLPLDFLDINFYSGKHMSCEIIDGVALGGARAACELPSLGVGEESVYQLKTSTTWAGSSRVASLRVRAYYNFPASTSVDASDSLAIAVNP